MAPVVHASEEGHFFPLDYEVLQANICTSTISGGLKHCLRDKCIYTL